MATNAAAWFWPVATLRYGAPASWGLRVELPIASYQTARNPEFLSQAALTACVRGVSQREHQGLLEASAPIGLPDASGLSKSAVGRRFAIAAADERSTTCSHTAKQKVPGGLDGLHPGSRLCGRLRRGGHENGDKKVLGLRQGTTEDAILCRDFFEGLVSRGFSSEQGVVFIVDGGKGLYQALREVLGTRLYR